MELAKRIYNGEDITADDNLLRQTAKQLLNGVEKGFNGNILSFNFSSPDFEALAKLTENVYHFSAAKNYHELKDLSLAIRDGNKIRSFEEFEAKAKEITNKYNVSWLRSEYNQALSSAQASARWNDFTKNKDTMPYLQYQAVMDNNTREEHAALHGVIKPITDPFWDTYMPPNGWGCRCEAVQLPGSNYEPTPNENISYPPVPTMFQINFGKQQLVFPPSHPYYRGIPQNEWNKLEKQTKWAVEKYYNQIIVDLAFNLKAKEKNEFFSTNLRTGKIIIHKRFAKNYINHVYNPTTKALYFGILKHLDELTYLKTEPLNMNKPAKNLKAKQDRGVIGYNYYTYKVKGVKYGLIFENINGKYETLYSVYIDKK